MTHHLPPEGEALMTWFGVAAEAARAVRDGAPWRECDVLADLELHLLLAQLSTAQAASARCRGWFDLPWPEQHLALRVHTRRFPTVDAYQPPAVPQPEPGDATAPARRRRAQFVSPGGVYLCSFDVRSVERSIDGQVQCNRVSATPAGAARLVVHARRCDRLRDLLEAADMLRLPPPP